MRASRWLVLVINGAGVCLMMAALVGVVKSIVFDDDNDNATAYYQFACCAMLAGGIIMGSIVRLEICKPKDAVAGIVVSLIVLAVAVFRGLNCYACHVYVMLLYIFSILAAVLGIVECVRYLVRRSLRRVAVLPTWK